MSYGLNSLRGGSILGVTKGQSRSLDYYGTYELGTTVWLGGPIRDV